MDINFVSSSSGGDETGVATSKSISHDCGTGRNRFLVVAVHEWVSTSRLTGITYSGIAMTKLNELVVGTHLLTYWYLYNPASGVNNIIVNWTPAYGTVIWIVGASYMGALQRGFPDIQTTNETTNTSIATSITTKSNRCWWIAAHLNLNTNSTAGNNTTFRVSGTYSIVLADGNISVTPPGVVTSNFNSTDNTHLGVIMASLKPDNSILVGEI